MDRPYKDQQADWLVTEIEACINAIMAHTFMGHRDVADRVWANTRDLVMELKTRVDESTEEMAVLRADTEERIARLRRELNEARATTNGTPAPKRGRPRKVPLESTPLPLEA